MPWSVALTLLASCMPRCVSDPPAQEAAKRSVERPVVREKRPGQPTVVFIVLDTVRADHMSLCGYERDTTPFLKSLAVRKGPVVSTCDAYAPGSWTVPSHASFFTGQSVAEHADDAIDRVLAPDVPTLAEAMKARGYQTLLVSANPTLSARSGLQRGFDVVMVAPGLMTWRAEALQRELALGLGRMDPAKPLFVYLNVFDAHDPFLPIGEGAPWSRPQARIIYDVHDEMSESRYHPFVRGQLGPAGSAAFARRVTDAYDMGILAADASVQRSVGVLVHGGWTEPGFRIVITSDHGEYLGERQRLRHGCDADQAVTRVPLMVYEPDRAAPLDLTGPVSGRQVFWLAQTGALAPEPVPAEAYAAARPEDPRDCRNVAAVWPTVDRKLVWRDGVSRAFDLVRDPTELAGTAVSAEEDAGLKARAEGYLAAEELALKTVDRRRRQEMEALGYVE